MDPLWLVTYDIRQPRRLRRVAALCEDYGRRLQYSVFLCRVSAEQIGRFKAQARAIIDRACDQVLVMPLCRRCLGRQEQLGVAPDLPGTTDTLIV